MFRNFLAPLTALFLLFLFSVDALAQQIESPDRRHVFSEDSKQVERVREATEKEALKRDAPLLSEMGFKAPSVEYLEQSGEMRGTGGVLISREGVQVEAEEVRIKVDDHTAVLKGDVLVSMPEGSFAADEGDFHLDNETGSFSNAEFTLDSGNYSVRAGQVNKLSDRKYKLLNCSLTTCDCPDGSRPWNIHSSEANITQESYAHVYNGWIDLFGVPVFYSPYLAFPVKQERQSGLLVPTFGYGSEDGFEYSQPIFAVIDDSTDVTFTPFIETRTRFGSGLEFRKIFSRSNRTTFKFVYSDEGARDGDLRGTNVSGLNDPTFDEERFGLQWDHFWRSERSSELSSSFVADVNFVSDDLFLREMEEFDFGRRSDRYTTSRLMFRTGTGSLFNAELMGEYNQAMLRDDDYVFQRLPELVLTSSKRFKPLGNNPYGLKAITRLKFTGTNFDRDLGYDGNRYNINPSLRIPFYYKNYANFEFEGNVHQTYYDLDETAVPGGGTLEDSNDRTVGSLKFKAGTALERIYDLPQENFLTNITGLGAINQGQKLTRLKHTIEPLVSYNFTPDTTQSDLPLFDSLDRIRERSVATYGVRTALFGRFDTTAPSADLIQGLTPELEDLPLLDVDGSIPLPGENDSFGRVLGNIPRSNVQIREIAFMELRQSYDYKEDHENNDPNRDAFSDVAFNFGFFPSYSFGLKFESNIDASETDMSSWGVASHFRDDRGDILRARYTYVENSVSQLEGNIEVVLTDRWKFGAYTRFDDRDSEFIENTFALRLESECNCWKFDLGVRDRLNPDRQEFTVQFTFNGLGDIAQKFGLNEGS